jgi:ABC-type polar amino acid transport system ATPase subunit
MQPEILLLDEPTSALDPESVGEILNILKLLVNSGITMLISTHEMEFAREVSTRVAFMDNGEILETNLPKEIFDSPHHKRTKNFLSRFLKSKILG